MPFQIKLMRILIILVVLLHAFSVSAQDYFPVNGVQDKRHTTYTFTHANIQQSSEVLLKNATLKIRDGKVVAVGTDLAIDEKSEVVIDLKGKYIYPTFIDLDSKYGMPEVPARKWNPSPQYETNVKGAYGWNQAVKPEMQSASIFHLDEKQAEAYLKGGFGAVLTHQHDGIFRGTGSLVSLTKQSDNKAILQPNVTAHFSFNKGSSSQQYPSSLMGAMALIRQTWYDADWYAANPNPDHENLSLEALQQQKELPWFFEARDYLEVLRASKLAQEFEQTLIVKGKGDEYKRIEEIHASGVSLILPLKFPDALDVSDPYNAMYAPLASMKEWELDPANATLLYLANVPFVFTAEGLKKQEDIFKQLREVVKYGIPKKAVIAALTSTPAEWIGATDLGSLEAGKRASFTIMSDNLFEDDAKLMETWVDGNRNSFVPLNESQISGKYNLNIQGEIFTMKVKTKKEKITGMVYYPNEDSTELKGDFSKELISFYFFSPKSEDGLWRFSGKINYEGKIWDGRAQQDNGSWLVWSAIRQEKEASEDKKEDETITNPEIGSVTYPLTAHGWDSVPQQQNFFFDNVTIWTCDSTGTFRGDVVVRDGKIAEVAKDIAQTPDLIYINGKGMHLTPGIVDEHSHIAISRGVNEGTEASSAEVRIGDVINPDDINIYRQLSGGVTTSQLLHGSANPIGGQSALIKLKWGLGADEMLIDDAPGFIKFALGENVKQSNWGDYNTIRFPQTRMGVEQVYYDYFYRAKAYQDAWSKYNESAKKKGLFKPKNTVEMPRKDLEMEALSEILDSNRFITCHSYVQSEINMLMHVSDSMGFHVNTFTHILEGYKVADKMKVRGIYASTFSDWWAYKFEVNEAIPYNAALLTEQGVLTGINSDDAEMGRRLNQEAAKTVKYGGVSEEEAVKMVTINPATMLHLQDRIGSVTVGKDADLVLWSGHPLSIYSKVEKTMIEGVIYFDRSQQEARIEAMEKERARLIAKMLKAKADGKKVNPVKPATEHLYQCETMEDELH